MKAGTSAQIRFIRVVRIAKISVKDRIPFLCERAIARAVCHAKEDGISSQTLTSIALNRAKGKIVAAAVSKRRHPFQGNNNLDSFVEASFAKLLRGDIRQCEPGTDLDTGRKTAPELERNAFVSDEVLTCAYRNTDIVPGELIIGGNVPGERLISQ